MALQRRQASGAIRGCRAGEGSEGPGIHRARDAERRIAHLQEMDDTPSSVSARAALELAALALGQAAPDTEALVVGQRVLEALAAHIA